MIKTTKKIIRKISPEKENALYFASLGGQEEIGRNCSFFEYKNEIVIIDAGIQFPEEGTPGVDFIIPNTAYLEPKKSNIRGIILTHGHYDHIHALPYLIEKLGNPIIYTAALTKALVEKRFEEFPNLPRPKIQIVKNADFVNISTNFKAEFYSMNISHSIPDSLGFVLHTPAGKMVHFGDFRVERDIDGNAINTEVFELIGKMNIHSAFLDSTNADVPGKSISEKTVEKELLELFKRSQGRIIVTTFASLLDRLAAIIKIGEKLDKKIVINGRSMKNNIQIIQNLGYFKIKSGLIIDAEEMDNYNDNKIMVLTTGGQGEPGAGLIRIANGEHKHIRFKSSDTVVFSSSVVPGNERSVQALQDNIARQVNEVFNYKLLDIHSSGHSLSEDLELVIKMIKSRFIVPVSAYYYKRKACAKLAQKMGIPKENTIMVDNGQVVEIAAEFIKITDKIVDTHYVMVDGLGVGDVEQVVLRDRKILSQEGMVVIIATIDKKSCQLMKNPDIISRGFIYLRESQELLGEIRAKIKGLITRMPRYQPIDADYLKAIFRDQIGELLYRKTKRRPMVLPVVIMV